MKSAMASIFYCLMCSASAFAQQVIDTRLDQARIHSYVSELKKSEPGYFYGLYVDGNFHSLPLCDSGIIRRFLSKPNNWFAQRSILISRLPELERLRDLTDSVLVYGPNSIERFVKSYVPTPVARRSPISRRRSFFSWNNPYFNYWGYPAYRYAYGRWYRPRLLTSVESNPNNLAYYMTGTNTNRYLVSSREK